MAKPRRAVSAGDNLQRINIMMEDSYVKLLDRYCVQNRFARGRFLEELLEYVREVYEDAEGNVDLHDLYNAIYEHKRSL